VDNRLLRLARATKGFMPDDEGLALYAAGLEAGKLGPLLEIGSYCGKSAIYLGSAAQENGSVLFSIDHHRGSEENQPGWEYHDPELVDPASGLLDTWPCFRRTVAEAGLDQHVAAFVARSEQLARHWCAPLALVFIDGGHSEEAVRADFTGWFPHLVAGGSLVIHDVFPDPAQGGQAPYNVYREALSSGDFVDTGAAGSLRVLRRLGTETNGR